MIIDIRSCPGSTSRTEVLPAKLGIVTRTARIVDQFDLTAIHKTILLGSVDDEITTG
ncbi:MAG: hypothetical protein ACLSH6_00230 [Limosilactobacillus pontis]